MRRGAVYWVNLEDAHPPEFGKIRPGVVVSNTIQNELLETVVVVPLSSRGKEIWPLRIKLSVPGNKDSFAVLPGIRQVNKLRLLDPIGQVNEREMREVDDALRLYLGDD